MYTLIIMKFRKMRVGSGGVDTEGRPMFLVKTGGQAAERDPRPAQWSGEYIR